LLAGAATVTGLFSVTVLIIGTHAPHRFELTECTAAVTICHIAVVAIFPGIQDTIPALRLYIAGSSGFITGGTIPAGVTGRRTVILGITKFIPVAEETVISTVVVIWGMETSSGCFITRIIRTGNPITAVNDCTKLTTTYDITGLYTVTEITIVAEAVIRFIHTGVSNFITGVNRACNTVTAVNGCACLARTATITGFISVTVLIVGTGAFRRFKFTESTAAVTIFNITVVTVLPGI
jgi:hypothetical protein